MPTITGDKYAIPMLCVKPANAYTSTVDVSDDNGKTWRGLGLIDATLEYPAYGSDGRYRDRTFTDYRKAEDAFFARLDAAGKPYIRCRDHVKCDVNNRG